MVILHPAYQLMQRKPVKGDETGEFSSHISNFQGNAANLLI
ncbi:hypothetical protein SFCCH060_3029 [Shigella flexneri CCH060]|uniref:Uncharacterized protein n=1 Tax=Shigella flexneri CCH060 TaxID=754091 RepID=A0A6N3R1F3_SHIFL|nr:hypothetical protein SFCCH060_3029 [Shigella flexneri CCH060]